MNLNLIAIFVCISGFVSPLFWNLLLHHFFFIMLMLWLLLDWSLLNQTKDFLRLIRLWFKAFWFYLWLLTNFDFLLISLLLDMLNCFLILSTQLLIRGWEESKVKRLLLSRTTTTLKLEWQIKLLSIVVSYPRIVVLTEIRFRPH